MHHPVLLNEVIDHLEIKEDGMYVDATLGEAGYTNKILADGGKVLAIDIDQEQLSKIKYQKELPNIKNLTLVQGNFKDIENIAKKNGFYPVDGVVFDLGLSMEQLNNSGKGLSFQHEDEDLDMRLDMEYEQTASDLLNTGTKVELYDIFAGNSEELKSKDIADAIAEKRLRRKFKTVRDLNEIIAYVLGFRDKSVFRRIYQALRITVNDEFNNLRKGLEGAVNIIKQDGKVIVVTFHSLEDRIVKQFAHEHGLKFETKKPVTSKNGKRYERSAKLRIITH